MIATIYLNDQAAMLRDEIGDIISYNVLPEEPNPEVVSPKVLP